MTRAFLFIIGFIVIVAFFLVLGLSAVGQNEGSIVPNGLSVCVSGSPDANFSSHQAINQLNKNIPTYKKAQAKTNVPWEAIAALHYREHNFDPTSDSKGEGAFGLHTLRLSDPGNPALHDFLAGAVAAATYLKEGVHQKVVGGRPLDSDPELLKNAFWTYNGRSYGSADKSPYVMNNFDLLHRNMGIITRDNGPIDGRDRRNGAYTAFVLLRNHALYDQQGNVVSYSTNCSAELGSTGSTDLPNNKVAAAAIEISNGLEKGTNGLYSYHPLYSETPRLKKFNDGKFWCTWLVILSFEQAGLPIPQELGANAMRDYFINHPERYTYIKNGNGAPQIGDVLFYSHSNANEGGGHVGIITAVRADSITTRESDVSKIEKPIPRSGNRVTASWGTIAGWGRVR